MGETHPQILLTKRKFFQREALEPVASSPAELAALLKREVEKYAKVIRAANITAQ